MLPWSPQTQGGLWIEFTESVNSDGNKLYLYFVNLSLKLNIPPTMLSMILSGICSVCDFIMKGNIDVFIPFYRFIYLKLLSVCITTLNTGTLYHGVAWSWPGPSAHLLKLAQVTGNCALNSLSALNGELQLSPHWNFTQNILEILAFLSRNLLLLGVYLL